MLVSDLTVPGKGRETPDRRTTEQNELGSSLLEHVDIGVASLDNGLRVRAANTALLRRFRRSFADIREQDIANFVEKSAQDHVRGTLTHLLSGRCKRIRSRALYQLHDGSTFAGELTGLSAREPGARDRIVVLISADEHPGRAQKKLGELDNLILEGLAAGVTTKTLARQLYLSHQGVEYHVRAMLREARVPSRNALVAWAYSQGILAVESWPPRAVREI